MKKIIFLTLIFISCNSKDTQLKNLYSEKNMLTFQKDSLLQLMNNGDSKSFTLEDNPNNVKLLDSNSIIQMNNLSGEIDALKFRLNKIEDSIKIYEKN